MFVGDGVAVLEARAKRRVSEMTHVSDRRVGGCGFPVVTTQDDV